MALEHVIREIEGSGSGTLLCGQPECPSVASHLLEFEWNGWSGLIGACDEHREDLDMLRIRARESEGRV